MLVLFDIDGTLVSVKGAGRRALARAIEAATGVPGAMDGVRLHGSTDPVIVEDAFRLHVRRPLNGPDEIEAILEAYLVHLEEEMLNAQDVYRVLPGADRLPAALGASGRHVVGLATGNVERAAMMKLRPGGLDRHFSFGGYGSDAGHRTELVRRGIERGQALAEQRLGRRFGADEVVVIGDTEKDVVAAHEAGARAVGVLVGAGDPGALREAQPDLLVESLVEPALWRYLGAV